MITFYQKRKPEEVAKVSKEKDRENVLRTKESNSHMIIFIFEETVS